MADVQGGQITPEERMIHHCPLAADCPLILIMFGPSMAVLTRTDVFGDSSNLPMFTIASYCYSMARSPVSGSTPTSVSMLEMLGDGGDTTWR